MFHRFISLFLVAALSLGAIATDSCSIVSSDCDVLAKEVMVIKDAMQTYKQTPSTQNADTCHGAALSVVQGLNKITEDAKPCKPTNSDAGLICAKLAQLAPQMTATLDIILGVQQVFKAHQRGPALCSDMQSIEASFKLALTAFFNKLAPFKECSAAVSLAASASVKLQSTRETCCAA